MATRYHSKLSWGILLLTVIVSLLIAPSPAHAASFTAVQNGDWSNPATWGGSVPTANDDVTIPNGITVFVENGSSQTRNAGSTITIDAGGWLQVGYSATLYNYGTITANGFLI